MTSVGLVGAASAAGKRPRALISIYQVNLNPWCMGAAYAQMLQASRHNTRVADHVCSRKGTGSHG